jgi:hypothetical protein
MANGLIRFVLDGIELVDRVDARFMKWVVECRAAGCVGSFTGVLVPG